MLTPILENLSAEFGENVAFLKVNTDESPDLGSQFKVSGLPTVVLMYGGVLQERIVGLNPEATYRSKLEDMIQRLQSNGLLESEDCEDDQDGDESFDDDWDFDDSQES